ncbi:MAG: phosphoribosylformylglycinamidine synthase subunit PurL [Chloroflexota bacterium]|nr:phosphoribosylformylglycinamidine synthase subunit PurL [Chloroflexota bacterium]MDE2841518.1 phosphoribosylformylglycinamidine synthase subunit PurL [Chloroflexota bacterium]MDE2930785.1 phosphoribosylformylglycinamidine synthase subunit PurL [Chloroflexota bacterium]
MTRTDTAVSDADLREVSLTRSEYERICNQLGRAPNRVELGMFGAMWSEHCGYKNSRPLLKLLPTDGKHVLIGAGEENAGAVDIGHGLAVVFKVESHNHPSAVEPFQGAATGIGGIVRDIFTMGARPIALLNSLRFGNLDDARNRYLFNGVVSGISHYGNCVGIPDVGGEVNFASCYAGNPLVNAMCVGIIPQEKLIRARARGTGNTLMLVGAATGRDGIHGASFASLDDPELSHRGVVQVGDPFMEKLLIEACLELGETDYLVGLQDLGAAGLTSSSVEAAHKGESGVDIDVSRVPCREEAMTPYEIMLSESQERMLAIVRQGAEEDVAAIFSRWGLHSTVIGRVTSDGMVRVRNGTEVAAEIPAHLLADAPTYVRNGTAPDYLQETHAFQPESLPELQDYNKALLALLASPNIASKECVFRQYDYSVQVNTVQGPGGDAAVLRVKGTPAGLAVTIDGNGQYCYLDPFGGGAIAVAEAARNLACVGAEPLALTNCLNFGNPEKTDVYYQLQGVIRGMAAACEALSVPVVSGNVSLYNETRGQPIYPTPMVGMLGKLESLQPSTTLAFQREGDIIALLGPQTDHCGGSEYVAQIHGVVTGRAPSIDLDMEVRVQSVCRQIIRAGLISSAHDCSQGGLAVALAESAIAGGVGFQVDIPGEGRVDSLLFGEGQSRIVVSLPEENLAAVRALAGDQGVPCTVIGSVQGDAVVLGDKVSMPLASAQRAWQNGVAEALAETG